MGSGAGAYSGRFMGILVCLVGGMPVFVYVPLRLYVKDSGMEDIGLRR